MTLKYLSNLHSLKRKHLFILLAAIVIIGFALRYLPFLHKLSIGDTYYQYSITQSIVENGHAPERLVLSRYPEGKSLLHDPLLLPYFIAYTFKLFQPLGVSLSGYMVIIPAVLGSAAAVPLYFLAEQLFDKRTALLSSFIYVILPASINRTFAGFVEKEGIASILFFTWLYLFVRSSKELSAGNRKSLLLPILSGAIMGLSFLSWEGAQYYVLLLAFSTFVAVMIRPDKSLAFSIALMTAAGFITLTLLRPSAYPIQTFLSRYEFATLVFVSFLAVIAVAPEYIQGVFKKKIRSIHLFGLIFLVALVSIISLNLHGKLLDVISSMIRNLSGSNIAQGVVEGQRAGSVGYTVTSNPFSLLIFFIPVGIYFYLKLLRGHPIFNRVLILSWLVTATFSAYMQVRLFFILAPVASMIISYGFFKLADPLLKQIESRGRETHGSKDSRHSEMFSPKAKIIILILIFTYLLFGTVMAEIRFADTLKKAQGERIDHWENAMEYVQDNTPKDSLVIAWWDYGYVIQGLGERATIADPGGGWSNRRNDIAKIFTSSEKEALKIIRQYNSDDKAVYVIVSYEEFGLANTINYRAGDSMFFYEHTLEKSGDPSVDEKAIDSFLDSNGIESYALENIGGYWRIWFTGFVPLDNGEYQPDRDMKNKLLPKLLPFNTGAGKGLEHFKLVYNDDSNFIFIYKVR